jgi:hypothetical protein
MKFVYLDSPHRGVSVPDALFDQVEALVRANCRCNSCKNPYTQENPQVAENRCKDCFLMTNGKQYHLRFLGLLKQEEHGKDYYRFIDDTGDIYVTCSTYESHRFDNSNKSARETLRHWGFPIPTEFYDNNGEKYRLHDIYTYIHGDVKTNAVVLVRYEERHYKSEPSTIFFYLSYRNGELKEFNKRKGEDRKLWLAAKARAEASKREDGYYCLHGHQYYQINDHFLYHLVADIASEK